MFYLPPNIKLSEGLTKHLLRFRIMILGMHNIVKRPVEVDGNIEIRPIMYLALSYDHRIIDGKEAVSFDSSILCSVKSVKFSSDWSNW